MTCYMCLITCFYVLFSSYTLAENTIQFNITNNGNNYNCTVNAKHKIKEGENVTISIARPISLQRVSCGNFWSSKKLQSSQNGFYETVYNVTKQQQGDWKCTFEIKGGNNSNNGNEVTKKANCETSVIVESLSDANSYSTLYIKIGGSVGGIFIILIIIIQAIIIIKYRIRLKNGPLPRLSTITTSREDPNRYSTMPGEKQKKKKNRQESVIYQSLENLRSEVSSTTPSFQRPPMPLPSDDEELNDDIRKDNVIADTYVNSGKTLNTMFAPDPPPTDTLPKRKEKKPSRFVKPKQAPAPKPKAMHLPEDYDYPDTSELIRFQVTHPTKKNSLPLPPKQINSKLDSPVVPKKKPEKPKGTATPGGLGFPVGPGIPGGPSIPGGPGGFGGAPIVNELQNHFKNFRKNTPTRPAPEPVAVVKQETTPDFKPKTKPEPPAPKAKPQAPQAKPFKPRPSGQTAEGPWSLERSQDTRVRELPQNLFPNTLGRSNSNARSPPVSRVHPVAKIAPIVKNPPVPFKPAAPTPYVVPTPVTEETYEVIATPPGSDDEEWTYEPLKQYNIYNNV